MAQEQRQQRQIQIKITDDVLRGVYSNMMAVSHTQEEFVLDFMNVFPDQGQGIVAARVLVAPGHMKRVLKALQENVKRFEDQFGAIKESSPVSPEIGFRAE